MSNPFSGLNRLQAENKKLREVIDVAQGHRELGLYEDDSRWNEWDNLASEAMGGPGRNCATIYEAKKAKETKEMKKEKLIPLITAPGLKIHIRLLSKEKKRETVCGLSFQEFGSDKQILEAGQLIGNVCDTCRLSYLKKNKNV